ncbi:type VI secretion system-associated FHA domain protein TagH [Defluviimonas sp. WL0002]|uniref:Type VI secretion system-associated FHA domain protein TagH n=1 Tax=Albidovulum marisflavi TaxID=2984159 RepID=A0ABT2ZDH1_9RHOB|nr:type VI secretion system-associated FHA domain protein TagH [Defluviimonas sp. WL0002]MCV2869190.1 type VI secretion system-associated FHA domain protein TagH [Defluviimonas sp. WL0002]
MAVTLRFQSTGTVPGQAQPVVMHGTNLTIGRGPENDLVLPDPDRMISKRHCVIEDHNGNVVVIDLSTNGTFLNYGKVPLGNVPTPLNDGDILSLGGYELLVSFGQAPRDPMAHIPDPLGEGPVSHGRATQAPDPLALLEDTHEGGKGDFLDDLLGTPQPTGPKGLKREEPDDPLLPPLGEDDLLAPAPEPEWDRPTQKYHNPSIEDSFTPSKRASIIPDDWDEDFLAPSAPKDAAPPAPPARPAPPPQNVTDFDDDFLAPAEPPEPAAPSVPDAAPEPSEAPEDVRPPEAPVTPAKPVAPAEPRAPQTPAARPDASDAAAARAFLDSLGVAELSLKDEDLAATLGRMGSVLKLMIEGIREILMTRTSIKGEFRINQTMISAGGNNPLKFSISPEQAVEAMVKPTQRGYLAATAATEQALNDIKAHEVAMVTGMEAALKGVLKRLDPKALEEKIQGGGGIGDFLKGKKARYWEVYEKMYAEISDQAENDFHDLFAREFSRAYQEQLDRLK